jgi:crotonobetainyl-CoA:carnitine CoA-transferase CaiB-like acyl-CoA transferase
MRLLGSAVSIGGFDDHEVGPPPLLGEHTAAILRELGRDDGEIVRLRNAGVIR